MAKRTYQGIRKGILKALKDEKECTYGYLERKVNTNWQSIRNHCEDLKILGMVTISKDAKVKITKEGLELLNKL